MVDRYKLRLLTKNYQKKAGQMARELLRLIIGEESLAEMVPQKEKEGRKLIPQKISNAILSNYITDF